MESLPPGSVADVQKRIEDALPGATVVVVAFRGDDHLQAEVEAIQFEGLSLLDQHRLVYKAVDGMIGASMHALALTTRVPKKGEEK